MINETISCVEGLTTFECMNIINTHPIFLGHLIGMVVILLLFWLIVGIAVVVRRKPRKVLLIEKGNYWLLFLSWVFLAIMIFLYIFPFHLLLWEFIKTTVGI